jgi:voltage-gated potassium channel
VSEHYERWERRFELPALVAALLVIPVIAIEQSDVGDSWKVAATVANWAIWLVFAAELLTLLVLAPDRWAFLRRHPLEVAIVVLTPPFLPASLQAFRVLRLLRLLRLLRVPGLARRVFSLEGLRYAAVLAALSALVGGAAFAAAEGDDVSTWDGLWWAVTTMTTVGYGDLYPSTTLGRLIAIALMLVGIGFVAILTAALAERFVVREVREELEQVEEDVGAADAELLGEIREIAERLRRVEERLARR